MRIKKILEYQRAHPKLKLSLDGQAAAAVNRIFGAKGSHPGKALYRGEWYDLTNSREAALLYHLIRTGGDR